MAGPLGKLVNLTSLNLYGRWHVEWVCIVCRCWWCVPDVSGVWGGWASDNGLGAEGAAAALAGALGKLVSLASLDVGGAWYVV